LKVLPAHIAIPFVFAFIPVHGVFFVAFPVAGREPEMRSPFSSRS
jgi:hypothetical protein